MMMKKGCHKMAEACRAHRQLPEQVKLAQALVAGAEDPRAGTTLMTVKVIDEWLGQVFNALEEEKPIVWSQFTAFSELFYAFDVQPLPPVVLDAAGYECIMFAGTGGSPGEGR